MTRTGEKSCKHGMVDDGLSCIQCALSGAMSDLDELLEIVEYLNNEQDGPQAELLVRDNIDDLDRLQKSIRTFLSKLDPEIEGWKALVTKLTREKYELERVLYEKKGLKP